jgi:protein-tyrosine-phosphatase
VLLRDANSVDRVGAGYRTLLLIRFSPAEKYQLLEKTIRHVLSQYGLEAIRADDRFSVPTLWENIKLEMDRCTSGIAILDAEDAAFNPNILIEIGYLLARNANLLLLKERSSRHLPADILGHLYREFDPKDIEQTTKRAVLEWLRDQRVAKRKDEKLVVFASLGGTCRCAMSKAILLHSLKERTLPFDLSVMSLAAVYGEARGASAGAREAIRRVYGEDLLQHHQVRKLYPALLDEADLVLCADAKLKEHFPNRKTQTIGEFFGAGEDIANPWPSDGTPDSAARYKACFEQLESLIKPQSEKLVLHLAKSAAHVEA